MTSQPNLSDRIEKLRRLAENNPNPEEAARAREKMEQLQAQQFATFNTRHIGPAENLPPPSGTIRGPVQNFTPSTTWPPKKG